MHRMLIGSRMLLSALPTDGNAANSPDHNQKAILVTGASTGIGRKITERLAADGYFVYAGARKEADLEALGAIQNVQAVRLDVTKPEPWQYRLTARRAFDRS
jgi:NADP-dependent 3-hydroxy acid dehydrogenase YdfG